MYIEQIAVVKTCSYLIIIVQVKPNGTHSNRFDLAALFSALFAHSSSPIHDITKISPFLPTKQIDLITDASAFAPRKKKNRSGKIHFLFLSLIRNEISSKFALNFLKKKGKKLLQLRCFGSGRVDIHI